MARTSRHLAAWLLACCVGLDVAVAACAKTDAGMPDTRPSRGLSQFERAGNQPLPTSAPDVHRSSGEPTTASTGPSRLGGSEPSGADPANRVTLAFAGDVHFERGAARLLTDPAPLTAAVRNTLGRADFAMVNLETALGDGGTPLPGKQYTFRAPVSSLDTLAAAGVDAVSMANNHAADFGDGVLGQTLVARARAPIPIVGLGRDEAEAFAPLRLDVKGVKVAVLASSQVGDVTASEHSAGPAHPGIATNLDPARLRAAVRAAARTSDLVVVMLHWGTQYTRCADDPQRATAAMLVADGADVIVGGHAHRPQGGGWFGPDDLAYVGYGLGNFVWYNNEGPSAETGVLTLTVDAAAARDTRRRAGARMRSAVVGETWSPMLVGGDGVPRALARGPTRTRLAQDWHAATECAGLDGSPG